MIRIEVTAEQVLHLGVRSDAGWLTDTHRFVPGSVLRGALAATWLAAHRSPNPDTTADAEFHRIFEGTVRFGPLYPTPDALRPLSVYGCKYPVAAACRAFTHDAAFEPLGSARCQHCNSSLVASKGTVSGVDIAEHTRVQLDTLERAQKGQLFARRALPIGTSFTGLIDGDLQGELAWLADDWQLRLGGRRSTAGLVTLRARPEPSPTGFTGFDPQRRQLVVRLLAPGIFVDDHGRPSWLPDLREVSTALGATATLKAAFARPTIVSGWHAKANLPKSQDFAVAAGSIFVLGFDDTLPDLGGLDRLWRTGIGLRRAEGNGWISLDRWKQPDLPQSRVAEAENEVDRAARTLIAHGIAALVMDDLRRYAQDSVVDSRLALSQDDILAQRRYRDLTPAAQDAFRTALNLPATDAAAVAQRLSSWDRTRTGRRGRTV